MNKSILCSPKVFKVPTCEMDPRLVALMMPFDKRFDKVQAAVKSVAKALFLDCKRADDVWNDSVIIQDVFDLIYKAPIVVCDLSGKNPNVLYEAGIAHVMGREVVMISQSLEDVPSDLRQHRALLYLPNAEGLRELKRKLSDRIKTLIDKVENYISVPTFGANEIIISRRWTRPKGDSGGIPPLMADSTETISTLDR